MNEMIARVAKAIAFAEGRENQAPSYALAAFAAIAASMRRQLHTLRIVRAEQIDALMADYIERLGAMIEGTQKTVISN